MSYGFHGFETELKKPLVSFGNDILFSSIDINALELLPIYGTIWTEFIFEFGFELSNNGYTQNVKKNDKNRIVVDNFAFFDLFNNAIKHACIFCNFTTSSLFGEYK